MDVAQESLEAPVEPGEWEPAQRRFQASKNLHAREAGVAVVKQRVVQVEEYRIHGHGCPPLVRSPRLPRLPAHP